MNIYFAGAIRGGRDDAKTYQKLIQLLKSYGNVLTEHVGNESLLEEEQYLSEKAIFDRDMEWLTKADVLIAEVSTPSLGVGYELAVAEKLATPCLCLFRKQQNRELSAMISGNSFFHAKTYSTNSELITITEEFINNFQ
jgi:2'-deoxynucleoside 5'-phosphate N-hydrolase